MPVIQPPAGISRLTPALAFAAALAVGSCGGSVGNVLGGAQDIAAGLVLPVNQEVALGAELSTQLDGELVVHPDAELQAYIASLGARVVAVADDRDPSINFTFTVVDDDSTINAFAIPGGHIYIYTGLLLAAESEAEVVAVLCHEVAHVTRRHSAERLVASYGLQAVTGLALGNDPQLLTQLAAQFAGTTAINGHSRAAETESDETGFRYMLRTGYDPNGFIDFFGRLTGGARPPQFLSTHPNPENRIERIQAMIRATPNPPRETGEASYLAMKSRI